MVLSLTSCTKIIDVDLGNQDQTRLVVDASIVNYLNKPDSGYQEIFLSHSRSYFDDVNSDNSVSGAVVRVKNNQTGVDILFQESLTEKGRYTTNDLVAVVGNGYTIHIEATIDGELQIFEGRDSIENIVPSIDSIFLTSEVNFGGDSVYEVNVNFYNQSTHDYFKFEVYFNDSLVINDHGNPNFFRSLIDDVILDEEVDEFRVLDKRIDPEEEQPPFRLKVKMKNITFQTYSYWRKLYVNAASGDDTPQTEVRGCVNNLTFPDRYALGTFMTSSESESSVDILEYPKD